MAQRYRDRQELHRSLDSGYRSARGSDHGHEQSTRYAPSDWDELAPGGTGEYRIPAYRDQDASYDEYGAPRRGGYYNSHGYSESEWRESLPGSPTSLTATQHDSSGTGGAGGATSSLNRK